MVLAEPLERTGILLPILPVFGFWVLNSDVSYSNLLFLVGLFYGALSVMRRSFRFGILAVFAGNGGLWMLLDGSTDYGFYQHPQLWLIPVALSVLVAGHVNRDQLTKDQMTMIRYATLMMIYVSSTSDIFINGVSESRWLTMILLALSVIGVLAGMVMRIRAFLFLGTAFLLLSLLALIWMASVQPELGLAVVRGRDRFRSPDHYRLCPVREEAPRDAGTGRAVKAMAGVTARLWHEAQFLLADCRYERVEGRAAVAA